MTLQYQINQKKLDRFFIIILTATFIFFSNQIQAQHKAKRSKIDLHYKYRDDNRWEGVKSKRNIKRSGTLTLESLIFYPENGIKYQAGQPGTRVFLYFYSPVSEEINVSVFALEEMYFMRPHPKNFNKSGWNGFKWSADILNQIKLPTYKLEGIAQARASDDLIYIPIYFTLPQKCSEYKLKLSLCSAKDSIIDLALYSENSDRSILKRESIRLVRDKLKHIHWKIAKKLASKTGFKLIATELSAQQTQKSPVQHIFHLYLKQL